MPRSSRWHSGRFLQPFALGRRLRAPVTFLGVSLLGDPGTESAPAHAASQPCLPSFFAGQSTPWVGPQGPPGSTLAQMTVPVLRGLAAQWHSHPSTPPSPPSDPGLPNFRPPLPAPPADEPRTQEEGGRGDSAELWEPPFQNRGRLEPSRRLQGAPQDLLPRAPHPSPPTRPEAGAAQGRAV